MKKKIYVFCFLALAFTAFSQTRQQDYNLKGDEAMRQFNYSDAKIWYEEGVSECNMYSISQLTKIWHIDESMHMEMRSVMGRCLACLNDRAVETRDTAVINMLIQYYTKGIGTQANENTVNFWREQIDAILNPYTEKDNGNDDEQRLPVKNRLNVFVGYSASQIAPAGLTVGIMGKSIGAYVRYRTNSLSPQQYTETVDKNGVIAGFADGYTPLGDKKVDAMMITGGLVFKPAERFLVSIGGGYWKRDLTYRFEKTNLTVTKPAGDFWAICEDFSYKGLAIDLDGILRIGKIFYVSAGCSFMDFKYAYGNAGAGVFF